MDNNDNKPYDSEPKKELPDKHIEHDFKPEKAELTKETNQTNCHNCNCQGCKK